MLRKDIEEKFPFLSVVTYGGQEYIGIINNQDSFITSMYIFTDLLTEDEKAKFIELGEVWWWESNRSIPINIFLREEWAVFKPYLQTFINKDFDIMYGPATSLAELNKRRTKKRSIQLVRKID